MPAYKIYISCAISQGLSYARAKAPASLSGHRGLLGLVSTRPCPAPNNRQLQLCPYSKMSEIPDFNKSELWVIETTLTERYGEKPDLQFADAEVRVRPNDRELTTCPVVYWQWDDCHFVIVKTGERRYRSQFYYEAYKQYSPGVPEFDDITNCVVATLQAQADQDAKRQGTIPGDARRPRSL